MVNIVAGAPLLVRVVNQRCGASSSDAANAIRNSVRLFIGRNDLVAMRFGAPPGKKELCPYSNCDIFILIDSTAGTSTLALTAPPGAACSALFASQNPAAAQPARGITAQKLCVFTALLVRPSRRFAMA